MFSDWFRVPSLLQELLLQVYIVKREVLKMSLQLDELVTQVTAIEEVGDSAIALLQGLKAQLDEAIAGGDPVALQELSDRLGAQAQELADAVAANTVANPI